MSVGARALLAAGLWWAWAALAVPLTNVEGLLLTDVEVEGVKRIDEAAVLAPMALRRGSKLTPEAVRRDIQAIYKTGFFDDVEVVLEQEGDEVTLLVRVKEKPAVREIKIEGEKKVEEDDLLEAMRIQAFGVLNEAEVQSSVRAMREVYLEKGFYLVDITPDLVEVGSGMVDLVFTIRENRKVLVQAIEFSGNENIEAHKIKRFLQVKEAGVVPWLTSSGTFDESLLPTDRQIVAQVYLEEGYVDVQVDAPKAYLSPDKRSIFLSYALVEGERYRLGKIDAEGEFIDEKGLTREAVNQILDGERPEDIQERQWREWKERPSRAPTLGRGAALTPGEYYKQSTIFQVRENIERLYQDQGYAFVNVVPLTDTNPETLTVDLTFRVETGEPVRIGRIEIVGNDPTFDKIVRREIQLDEGDLYRGSLIRASKMRLERLGFFEEVNISTPKGAGPGVLDMNVQVAEQPTGSFSLGAGYSNLESVVVTANVAKNNFLGLGFNMSSALNWSRLRRQFTLSFLDPYFLDSRWLLNVNGYSVTRNFTGMYGMGAATMGGFASTLGGGMNEYQRGGSIGVGRYLDARDDLQLRMDYTIEDVGLTNIDAFKRRMFGGELYRNGLTSTVGLTFSVDKRNNRIFPTHGFYGSMSSSLSGGFRTGDDIISLLGGDFHFVENRLNARWYKPLLKGNDRFVFRANSTMGVVTSTDGGMVPFIHRYRAGGINSVRGYNWFSLGPTVRAVTSEDPGRADDELIVGGTQTWVNNFEIETQIVRSAGITGVVFFDAGNAFGDPWGEGNLSISGLRSSYGLGIRWRSPMGPLRFEWGVPVQRQPNERPSVFDFSIGSFF